jgi:hypothetical protein
MIAFRNDMQCVQFDAGLLTHSWGEVIRWPLNHYCSSPLEPPSTGFSGRPRTFGDAAAQCPLHCLRNQRLELVLPLVRHRLMVQLPALSLPHGSLSSALASPGRTWHANDALKQAPYPVRPSVCLHNTHNTHNTHQPSLSLACRSAARAIASVSVSSPPLEHSSASRVVCHVAASLSPHPPTHCCSPALPCLA